LFPEEKELYGIVDEELGEMRFELHFDACLMVLRLTLSCFAQLYIFSRRPPPVRRKSNLREPMSHGHNVSRAAQASCGKLRGAVADAKPGDSKLPTIDHTSLLTTDTAS
jgi:hypothetical protein